MYSCSYFVPSRRRIINTKLMSALSYGKILCCQQEVGVKETLTFLDKEPLLWNKKHIPSLIPFFSPHLSLTESFRAYPILSKNQYQPLRQALNKQEREKHGLTCRAKAPRSLPALQPTQSKWTQYFSSNFIQPAAQTSIQRFRRQGCTDTSIPAMIHENTPPHTHAGSYCRCR